MWLYCDYMYLYMMLQKEIWTKILYEKFKKKLNKQFLRYLAMKLDFVRISKGISYQNSHLLLTTMITY